MQNMSKQAGRGNNKLVSAVATSVGLALAVIAVFGPSNGWFESSNTDTPSGLNIEDPPPMNMEASVKSEPVVTRTRTLG